MTEETTPKTVYQAIAAVQGELAKKGIAKDRKNSQQGYSFRGIDDIYGALASLLAANGLCILPRVLSRSVTERQTKNGGSLFYTVVDVEYDFVSSSDNSKHTVRVVGEAMDSGDKSSNKAMSAAYKYACLQTFCIPTEGDNDADAVTHEVAAEVPREVWKGNLVQAFASALTIPDLTAAWECEGARISTLQESGVAADLADYQEIFREYQNAGKRIKAGKTVDSMMGAGNAGA